MEHISTILTKELIERKAKELIAKEIEKKKAEEAGLSITIVDGEVNYIGTDKQWEKFEQLKNE